MRAYTRRSGSATGGSPSRQRNGNGRGSSDSAAAMQGWTGNGKTGSAPQSVGGSGQASPLAPRPASALAGGQSRAMRSKSTQPGPNSALSRPNTASASATPTMRMRGHMGAPDLGQPDHARPPPAARLGAMLRGGGFGEGEGGWPGSMQRPAFTEDMTLQGSLVKRMAIAPGVCLAVIPSLNPTVTALDLFNTLPKSQAQTLCVHNAPTP